MKRYLLTWSVLVLLGFAPALIDLAAATQNAPQNDTDVVEQQARPAMGAAANNLYYLPDRLAPGIPGEVIHSERWDGYALPYKVSAVRILYHSVSARGQDVAASGVVLLPDSRAPADGWPVIAWAHPFTGAASTCAPSLMKGLYGGAFLSVYVNMGYAVVAPDYAGLGTASRSAALDAQSNATDLIYSVKAARTALPQLGTKWIAVGERHGGLAALIADERELNLTDSGYFGSIAIDPVLDLKADIEASYQQGQDKFAFLAYGLKTLYPEFNVRRILSPSSISDYNVVGNRCYLARGLSGPESRTMVANWNTDPLVIQFLRRNTLGLLRAKKPILLVSSSNAPFTSGGSQTVTRMCKQGDNIDLEPYDVPGDNLMGESVSTQLSWIRARFSGSAVYMTCPTGKNDL